MSMAPMHGQMDVTSLAFERQVAIKGKVPAYLHTGTCIKRKRRAPVHGLLEVVLSATGRGAPVMGRRVVWE